MPTEVSILIVRKLPRRAIQPEGRIRSEREDHLSIQTIFRRQKWHTCARFKCDTNKLSVRRTVCSCRFRLWSPHSDACPAMLLHNHYLPMAYGTREKRASTFTLRMPDRFDKRRVRSSVLFKDKHFILRCPLMGSGLVHAPSRLVLAAESASHESPKALIADCFNSRKCLMHHCRTRAVFSAGHVVVICDVVEVALLVTVELACPLCGEADYAPELTGAPAHAVIREVKEQSSIGENIDALF